MMNPNVIEQYIEKIYGYAVSRTYSRDEADELSQEILYTLLRELPKLRDKSRFEPWLWGIANNVTKSFRRFMGKQRAMYSYDVLEIEPFVEDFDKDTEILYDFLRTKIAMLSEIYRDIIILYYYDGLSIKKISERLNIPEGTVTWRLSEARKKLKKECDNMNETILRPVCMNIGIYGSGNYNGSSKPFPSAFINDALSQNILYYCYEKPNTVEGLSKLCGVPAYYIEDRINNLLYREAVIEVTKGKFQTDFVIWSDKYGIYCEENAENALMPIMDDLIDALKRISKEAMKIDFYKAGKNDDLFYLFGAMAFDYASRKYCSLPYPQIKKKYDGNQWCYIGNMETNKHKRICIGIQTSANMDGFGCFLHRVYRLFGGAHFRQMMYDKYINACADILISGKSDDAESVANAIKDGYIIQQDDGKLFVTASMFTIKQKEQFDRIVEKHLIPLIPNYSEIVNNFVKGYKRLFPKHLEDDADRMCQNMFFGMYLVIVNYAQRTEKIKKPSSEFCCDVIQQFK